MFAEKLKNYVMPSGSDSGKSLRLAQLLLISLLFLGIIAYSIFYLTVGVFNCPLNS